MRRRRALTVDLFILFFLGSIHIASWLTLEPATIEASYSRMETAARLRDTASAGLTVVGILIPLTVIAVQLKATSDGGDNGAVSKPTLIDLLVASAWLLASLVCGLYVLYRSAFTGYKENLFTHSDVGIFSGFQLFFLLVGVIRLVWGLATIVAQLLSAGESNKG
jgi:hypothetical protein